MKKGRAVPDLDPEKGKDVASRGGDSALRAEFQPDERWSYAPRGLSGPPLDEAHPTAAGRLLAAEWKIICDPILVQARHRAPKPSHLSTTRNY
jgi:hypothetical protein